MQPNWKNCKRKCALAVKVHPVARRRLSTRHLAPTTKNCNRSWRNWLWIKFQASKKWTWSKTMAQSSISTIQRHRPRWPPTLSPSQDTVKTSRLVFRKCRIPSKCTTRCFFFFFFIQTRYLYDFHSVRIVLLIDFLFVSITLHFLLCVRRN